MAKGSPSLIALLGLLAVAGYQNRDKLSEVLGPRAGDPGQDPGFGSDQGGFLDQFRQLQGRGGLLGGLSELFDRFAAPHQKAKVESWVQRGPNAPLSADELAQALDEDTLAELQAKTGLSREELLARLSTTLPEAVDRATPDGHFPPINAPEPRSL